MSLTTSRKAYFNWHFNGTSLRDRSKERDLTYTWTYVDLSSTPPSIPSRYTVFNRQSDHTRPVKSPFNDETQA